MTTKEVTPDLGPFTCWVGETTFRKNGTPVLGTMGASSRRVVVMTTEDFKRIAKQLPQHQFRIGDLDG